MSVMNGKRILRKPTKLGMKYGKYDFKVGDKVIDVWGRTGEIVDICTCERCKERGFYELEWVENDKNRHHVSDYDASQEFADYYQIGEYRFDHEFRKGDVQADIMYHEECLEKVKKDLALIEELEKEGHDVSTEK